MPSKTKTAAKLLKNELSRLENTLQAEVKKLSGEQEQEKRQTRLRAIAEEIVDLKGTLSEYRDRFKDWSNKDMREAFDEYGRYRCPRCWVKHAVHFSLTPLDSGDDIDNFRCNKCGST